MKPSAAGKGSDPRPVKLSEYVKNFDQIKWSKDKREPTKTKKGKQIYVYR
jgi:hypothetical protein